MIPLYSLFCIVFIFLLLAYISSLNEKLSKDTETLQNKFAEQEEQVSCKNIIIIVLLSFDIKLDLYPP